MINYEHIIVTINGLIREETNRPVVVQGSTDDQPNYPFASYTITSPNIVVSRARRADSMTEDVETVISLTWHSESNVEAMSLSQRTEALFKRSDVIQRLSDLGIAIVRTLGNGTRDTFISIETERRYGFDLRVRTRHIDSNIIEDIETVSQ
ncbi:hypothetical protein M4D55_23395 [Metabacillus idriensis]|uniref:phage neck terminator protein n=1 Tax=Metabacillus idriensis TaxID=324768 RepID=UPI00203ED2F5|nr:hypothetical protein [Metabacillus idriensis]MCM3598708.1 hypothetical protein [Metabacillus idriensis]